MSTLVMVPRFHTRKWVLAIEKAQLRTFDESLTKADHVPFPIYYALEHFSFLTRRFLRGHPCKWVFRSDRSVKRNGMALQAHQVVS